MTCYPTMLALAAAAAAAAAAVVVLAGGAWADEQTPSPPAPNQAAPPAAPPAAAPSPPPFPAMAGALTANPGPTTFDLGLLGKKVTVTGAVTGFGQWQDNVSPGDHDAQLDVSNAQIFINKSDGLIQYFLEVGAYSLPAIGTPYIPASRATRDFYGVLPQGFLKIAPTASFSIEAGALPTLAGAEDTFSFENMNIERGLLWNQENAVNRGVQVNYAMGPVAFSASLNDGYYSGRYSWLSGSATWTIDKTNTLELVATGNTAHTDISTVATLLFQNNQQLYNIIYTHTQGPWTIEPYFQYTHVPRIPGIGALQAASTYGGALLVSYAFAKSKLAGFSVPVRMEFIASTGAVANGAPNLLYGAGSKAWSITVTPTYQYRIYFIRAELSYVGTSGATAGSVFGPTGAATSQTRALLETGLLF